MDECEPLPRARWSPPRRPQLWDAMAVDVEHLWRWSTCQQGLTLAHFRAQLEDLRDTSLTLELNLSTFGTHPRINLCYMGDRVSLS